MQTLPSDTNWLKPFGRLFYKHGDYEIGVLGKLTDPMRNLGATLYVLFNFSINCSMEQDPETGTFGIAVTARLLILMSCECGFMGVRFARIKIGWICGKYAIAKGGLGDSKERERKAGYRTDQEVWLDIVSESTFSSVTECIRRKMNGYRTRCGK